MTTHATREEKTAGGWQPIETAPRGRKVLAGFFNEAGNWRTITATYYPPKTLDWNSDYDGGDEDGYAEEGWYEESETHENILPTNPSHWQPLPDPPTSTTEAAADRAIEQMGSLVK